MRHARAWLAMGGLMLSGLIACSMDAASDFNDRASQGPTGKGDDDDGGGGDSTGEPPPVGAQGAPTSNGVLIVNAARFSAFRLCFSEHMELAPQPDSKVMPQANVVGVDIGSVVRVDPLQKPGTIYVIREFPVRSRPGDKPKACKDWIKKKTNGGDQDGYLIEGVEYVTAKTPIDRDLGVKQAEVLAISGCGSKAMLRGLDGPGTDAAIDTESCGTTWNEDRGNADAFVVPLATTVDKPNDTSIPIALYNMAPAVDALKGQLAVSFGSGDAGTSLTVAAPFQAGSPAALPVTRADEAAFGQKAFTLKTTIGSTTTNTVLSLADVQAFSSPADTPTSYYYAASNYALLLLGDPSYKEVAGGVFNPSRAMHILAVPVLDPSQIDAGVEVSDAGDAGVP